MGRTACTEPQCLYKCTLYLLHLPIIESQNIRQSLLIMELPKLCILRYVLVIFKAKSSATSQYGCVCPVSQCLCGTVRSAIPVAVPNDRSVQWQYNQHFSQCFIVSLLQVTYSAPHQNCANNEYFTF